MEDMEQDEETAFRTMMEGYSVGMELNDLDDSKSPESIH